MSKLETEDRMPMIDAEQALAHATPADLDMLAIIGHGCEGAAAIYLSKHKQSKKLVAVKKIDLEKCKINYKLIEHELWMHKQLNHANILPSIHTFVHMNEIWSVMPLMAFGSCRDLIQAHFQQGLPELAIAFILREVLQGLEYIHHRALIHRDIRASHILISGSGQVCLTGLRHSHSLIREGVRMREIHDFPNHYNNCLLWASPELLQQSLSGYDTKSDIYSLGITACELANGIVPFSDMPITQMLIEKLDGITPRLMDVNTIPELDVDSSDSCEGSTRPTDSPHTKRSFSSHFHNFVQTCLKINTKERPSAFLLLRHPFFLQLKKKSSSESLPSLLHPVTPISETAKLHIDDTEEVIDQLQMLSTGDTQWNF